MKCIYDEGKKSEKAMRNVAKTCKVCVDTRSGVSCTNGCVIELLDRNLMVKLRLEREAKKVEALARRRCGVRAEETPLWKFAQSVRKIADGIRVADEQASLEKCKAFLDAEDRKSAAKPVAKKPAKSKR